MWNVSLTSSAFVFERIKRGVIGLEQEDAWQGKKREMGLLCGTLHQNLIHPCHILEGCGERGYSLAKPLAAFAPSH